jgi:Rho-type GTPase-activating protein 1/2
MLSRSLTNRFDNLKSKYKRDLEPMIAERQSLQREIHELKQAKDLCLEETTALTARNDELQELNVVMTRQLENLQGALKPRNLDRKVSKPTPLPPLNSATSINATITTTSNTTSTLASMSSNGTYVEDRDDARYGKGAKSDSEATSGNTIRKFAWFKGKEISPTVREALGTYPRTQASSTTGPPPPEKPKVTLRHNFQQQSVLRFARCDHCGDKMWGTQLRCLSEFCRLHA